MDHVEASAAMKAAWEAGTGVASEAARDAYSTRANRDARKAALAAAWEAGTGVASEEAAKSKSDSA